ncbi:MAG: oxidoreductase [Methylocystis sp.]|nr:oxidoreductase [Alphaproteobacteria bacterium]NBT22585.1 oxidoreductase [Methylocystaceae bacterium]NBV94436.1 oxidoreductase [Methylocystaceae bacterium]
MPSLIRLLLIIGLLIGLVYGAMQAIVSYVTPQPREMSHIIPPQRLNK